MGLDFNAEKLPDQLNQECLKKKDLFGKKALAIISRITDEGFVGFKSTEAETDWPASLKDDVKTYLRELPEFVEFERAVRDSQADERLIETELDHYANVANEFFEQRHIKGNLN